MSSYVYPDSAAIKLAGFRARLQAPAGAEQRSLSAWPLEHLRRIRDSAEWHRRAKAHAAAGFNELAL